MNDRDTIVAKIAELQAQLAALDAKEAYQKRLGSARRCPKCNGCGAYDDGYQGWFAPPSIQCDECCGTGIVT